MKKKFKLSHIWLLDWQAIVEIDEAKAAEAIKVMVDFWSGSEDRLARWDRNYQHAFLEQLAEQIFHIQVEHGLNHAKAIIQQFDGREGWYKMDGSNGIKIISVEKVEFDGSDFSFEEL